MDEDEDEDGDDEEEEEEDAEAKPSAKGKGKAVEEGDEEEGGDEAEEGAEEEAEAAEEQPAPIPTGPPRILITTSPGPSKPTYAFCDDLKSIFPGGEFFKRPKGRGFELGRVARWGAKRGFQAVVIVNEDHKAPSEWASLEGRKAAHTPDAITLINLPAGPTAYFKLSSVQLGSEIYVSWLVV